MKKQIGFTLIELVTVIVILGILAAFAVPRFINLTTQARAATVKGVAGSIKAASALGHSLAIVKKGQESYTGTITVGSDPVDLKEGYLDATKDGLGLMLQGYDGSSDTYNGFNITVAPGTPGTITFIPEDLPASTTACTVTYTEATAALHAQTGVDVSDCS